MKARASGKIKFFKSRQGYGFITPDDGTADVFVHVEVAKQCGFAEPEGGMRVQFEVVQSRKGRRAAWIG